MRFILHFIEDLFFRVMFVILQGENRNKLLRMYGVTIGKGCQICTSHFSTEPYLIEIGDDVGIASGTVLITHDGAVKLFRDTYPDLDLFGRITIGDHTFIGSNCTILPNTKIGSKCIIGAGSVVRGVIPDNSVVMGNPAKVIMNTNLAKTMLIHNKHSLNTKKLSFKEKKKRIIEHFNKQDLT